jgi:hypothetical protein
MGVDRLRRRALLELLDGGYESWEVAAFFGPQPPPALHNREGHALVQCTATYDVPGAEAEAVWSRPRRPVGTVGLVGAGPSAR